MSKEKKEGPKTRRRRGEKGDASAAAEGNGQDKTAEQTPNMPAPAHLYVGPRDVRIKLGAQGMLEVLKDQKEIRREITQADEHMIAKQKQIDEAQELLAKRRAEYREIESMKEECHERLLDIIDANADGYHLERIEVDEVFMSGEIITYRKGTKEEVGERRNALPAEWEAAQKAKTDGKPVDRWQKALPEKAQRKGFVVIDGGKEGHKEVRASGDGAYGYIGPDEDPKKPRKEKDGDAKKKPKKDKEPKVLPDSLREDNEDDDSEDEKPVQKNGKPAAGKGTYALRLLDGENQIGAVKVVRQCIDVSLAAAKKIICGPFPIELMRFVPEATMM